MPQQFARPKNHPVLRKNSSKRACNSKPDDSFVGSFHKTHIEGIIAIECAECNTKLYDCYLKEIPPMTGYCGHLFCKECAKVLYGKLNNKPINRDLWESFQFECEPKSEHPLYLCRACKTKVETKEEEVPCRVNLFSTNIMLQKLFHVLNKPGFECKRRGNGTEWKDCAQPPFRHPLNNSLRCITCSDSDPKDDRFTCVWHAKEHKGCALSIMDESFMERASMETLFDQEYHLLACPDRSERPVFAALYHCACCGDHLINILGEMMGVFNSHLECGHFVGGSCVENASAKVNVFCIFCGDNVEPRTDTVLRRSAFPRSRQLAEIVTKDPLYTCNNHCSTCKFQPCKYTFPSPTKPKNGRCQWCEVEHQLKGCNKDNK